MIILLGITRTVIKGNLKKMLYTNDSFLYIEEWLYSAKYPLLVASRQTLNATDTN